MTGHGLSDLCRVLIVDDHPIVREGFAALINGERDMEVTGQANDYDEALKVCAEAHPDLAIVDISLPGKSGLDLIGRLKNKQPDLPILVVSMHAESVFAERALRAGASGYVMKAEATEYLLEAIRKVMSGGLFLTNGAAQSMIERLVSGGPDKDGSPIRSLSEREFEVFQLIGKGFKTSQIARELFISTKTVETHRANMKRKLGLEDGAALTHRAVHWVVTEPDSKE